MADISKIKLPGIEEELNVEDTTARELAVNAVTASIGYTDQEIDDLKDTYSLDELDNRITNTLTASIGYTDQEINTVNNNIDNVEDEIEILDEKVINTLTASIGYTDQEIEKVKLPNQSGQNGKFLTTDGTDASWQDVAVTNGISSILTIISDTLIYTINHNLNTRDVIVNVYDLSDYSNAVVEVSRPTNNSVQIEFAEQLTVGKQFKVMIISMNTVASIPSGEEVKY